MKYLIVIECPCVGTCELVIEAGDDNKHHTHTLARVEEAELEETPANRDSIRMHLEEHLREFPYMAWNELLGFCLGYYGEITIDHIHVVRELEREGKLL